MEHGGTSGSSEAGESKDRYIFLDSSYTLIEGVIGGREVTLLAHGEGFIEVSTQEDPSRPVGSRVLDSEQRVVLEGSDLWALFD